MAGLADAYGIVVEQAEDEIAAINMVIGATYAGVPALTTTSGGGFALMVEGISLAGMTELPAVVLLAQRPGPATGMPTRTAQQDLLFALQAGHGEFVKAIYAPGTIAQCFQLMRHSIAQAHKYQTPVIILTDQYLQDAVKNIPALDLTLPQVDRQIVPNPPKDYRRYAITDSGISPRAIPGGPHRVVVDSDEHDERGKLCEDLAMHLRQQDKRMRKGTLMAGEALPPEQYGPAHAEHLLVCWGSSYGACREAVDALNRDGGNAALLHFSQVWPLNVPAVTEALRGFRRVTVVEGNGTGQFAALLRFAGIMQPHDAVLQNSGLAFTADFILAQLHEVCA
jgi:2-oxoglutarate ferredoxin oxidoreductase subunit alpha